jgi:hypothetical protein
LPKDDGRTGDVFKQIESLVRWIAASGINATPRNDASGGTPCGLKGGKFEMNRSQCPVAKILMYIEVHKFSFLSALKEENLR